MHPRTFCDRLRCKTWLALAASAMLALVGCSSVPRSSSPPSVESSSSRPSSHSKNSASAAPVLPRAGSGRGGYYMDDGPGDAPPEGLLDVPDAEPRIEAYSPRANRPYVVFGKTYTPITDDRPFKQRGIGSWYGKKFHGQKTSSGELYDMYQMTAAHPTLPIPSYARVTNLANGKQVIVRVNDRGPFHSSRIIDLSYTAALKLGYLGKGSSELEVERLLPEEIARMANGRKEQLARAEQATPTPEVLAVAATIESAPRMEAAEPVSASTKTSVIERPPASPSLAPSGFYLQLGSYTEAVNAETARSRLNQASYKGLPPVEVVAYGMLYRLYSGPFATRAEAAALAQQLQESGTTRPFIVQR